MLKKPLTIAAAAAVRLVLGAPVERRLNWRGFICDVARDFAANFCMNQTGSRAVSEKPAGSARLGELCVFVGRDGARRASPSNLSGGGGGGADSNETTAPYYVVVSRLHYIGGGGGGGFIVRTERKSESLGRSLALF